MIPFVDDLDQSWKEVEEFVYKTFGKSADLQVILFLIGVQELGFGPQSFSKEQKLDIIHIGICKVLSYSGFYSFVGHDGQGWPLWVNSAKLPALDLGMQEVLLKQHIIYYFRANGLLP